MKNYLYLSVAALAFASCSNDEFLGEGAGQSPSANSSNVIGFGTEALNATRAGEVIGKTAAEKLGNEFVVYGFKSGGFT